MKINFDILFLKLEAPIDSTGAGKQCDKGGNGDDKSKDKNGNTSKEQDSRNEKNHGKNGKQTKKPGKNKNTKKTKDGIPKKNDWSFYAINEQIAKDVASIPYNRLPGRSYAIELQSTKDNGINPPTQEVINKNVSTETVMTIEYVPAIGKAQTRADGVNIAGQQLYTWIRSKNSGGRNYEAPDVMMYVLEMRDIYRQFFECKRSLGLATGFSYQNKALPSLILYALGIDEQDLTENLADYRGRLNRLATKINALAMPKYFKLFERTAFISSYIFMDSNSIRGQFYAYKSVAYYTWSSTTSQTGTELIMNPLFKETTPKGLKTLKMMLDILEQQVMTMLSDEDVNVISGDIYKAFGEGALYTLLMTDENYKTQFIMDENALGQIQNARGLDLSVSEFTTLSAATQKTFNIQQANAMITWAPVITQSDVNQGLTLYPRGFILNSHKDSPDYRDNLEWTRLMCGFSLSYKKDTPNKNTVEKIIDCFGLEIVTGLTSWRVNEQQNYASYELKQCVYVDQLDENDALQLLTSTARIMQYDWHPTLYFIDETNQTITIGTDIKMSTIVDYKTMQALHDSASEASVYAASLYGTSK